MFTDLEASADRYRALGDVNRLRIVALCRAGEVGVSELVDVLGISQPRVSQHLKLLCEVGLLNRFRDGKRVFYRLVRGADALNRRLLAALPESDQFIEDAERLRGIRGTLLTADADDEAAARLIARALIDLTVAAPVGDLLDVGCGRGKVLKLLAGRANRAVGVDIDAEARNIARAAVFLAGHNNCSLRQGDMYRLPFADESFDTIVLDDVLRDASEPERALREATRLLKSTGRLLILSRTGSGDASLADNLAEWCRATGLRMAPPRWLPAREPEWFLSVLTVQRDDRKAA